MMPAARLTTTRILGIQHLVASSVPGLETFDVAVLDENGDLVSNGSSAQGMGLAPLTERDALENFFAAKATRAIRMALPSLTFEVTVSARELSEDESGRASGIEESANADQDADTARVAPERDGFALRALVRTTRQLGPEERSLVERALIDALKLDDTKGDVLVYATGPLSNALASPEQGRIPDLQLAAPSQDHAASVWDWDKGWPDVLLSRWALILLVVIALIALVLRPRRRLSQAETEQFAQMLKTQIHTAEQRDAAR